MDSTLGVVSPEHINQINDFLGNLRSGDLVIGLPEQIKPTGGENSTILNLILNTIPQQINNLEQEHAEQGKLNVLPKVVSLIQSWSLSRDPEKTYPIYFHELSTLIQLASDENKAKYDLLKDLIPYCPQGEILDLSSLASNLQIVLDFCPELTSLYANGVLVDGITNVIKNNKLVKDLKLSDPEELNFVDKLSLLGVRDKTLVEISKNPEFAEKIKSLTSKVGAVFTPSQLARIDYVFKNENILELTQFLTAYCLENTSIWEEVLLNEEVSNDNLNKLKIIKEIGLVISKSGASKIPHKSIVRCFEKSTEYIVENIQSLDFMQIQDYLYWMLYNSQVEVNASEEDADLKRATRFEVKFNLLTNQNLKKDFQDLENAGYGDLIDPLMNYIASVDESRRLQIISLIDQVHLDKINAIFGLHGDLREIIRSEAKTALANLLTLAQLPIEIFENTNNLVELIKLDKWYKLNEIDLTNVGEDYVNFTKLLKVSSSLQFISDLISQDPHLINNLGFLFACASGEIISKFGASNIREILNDFVTKVADANIKLTSIVDRYLFWYEESASKTLGEKISFENFYYYFYEYKNSFSSNPNFREFMNSDQFTEVSYSVAEQLFGKYLDSNSVRLPVQLTGLIELSLGRLPNSRNFNKLIELCSTIWAWDDIKRTDLHNIISSKKLDLNNKFLLYNFCTESIKSDNCDILNLVLSKLNECSKDEIKSFFNSTSNLILLISNFLGEGDKDQFKSVVSNIFSDIKSITVNDTLNDYLKEITIRQLGLDLEPSQIGDSLNLLINFSVYKENLRATTGLSSILISFYTALELGGEWDEFKFNPNFIPKSLNYLNEQYRTVILEYLNQRKQFFQNKEELEPIRRLFMQNNSEKYFYESQTTLSELKDKGLFQNLLSEDLITNSTDREIVKRFFDFPQDLRQVNQIISKLIRNESIDKIKSEQADLFNTISELLTIAGLELDRAGLEILQKKFTLIGSLISLQHIEVKDSSKNFQKETIKKINNYLAKSISLTITKEGTTIQEYNLLKEKLESVQGTINEINSTSSTSYFTQISSELSAIIPNVRSCLTCIAPGLNNETMLSVSDPNRFVVLSQNENGVNVADQIVVALPITYGNKKELAVVLDNIYGAVSPAIFFSSLSHIIANMNKAKQRSLSSIFVPKQVLKECLTSEKEINKFVESLGLNISREIVNFSVSASPTSHTHNEFDGVSRRNGGVYNYELEGWVIKIKS